MNKTVEMVSDKEIRQFLTIARDAAYTPDNPDNWAGNGYPVYFCQVYADRDYKGEIDSFVIHRDDLADMEDAEEAERFAIKYVREGLYGLDGDIFYGCFDKPLIKQYELREDMKKFSLEHYDNLDDQIVFWCGIADVPQEYAEKGREIDGDDYSHDCFGTGVIFDVDGFCVMTHGESNAEVFYTDNNGYKHYIEGSRLKDSEKDVLFRMCRRTILDNLE